ncbi:MAG TPA: hypothetical protein O0X51_04500, partial [Methanocorpusculum sp.]|nr:hypothetical protein [Methanocorpusculum sp.]
MKNTKIMAVLVVLLAAMLFVGAASAYSVTTSLNSTVKDNDGNVYYHTGESILVNITYSGAIDATNLSKINQSIVAYYNGISYPFGAWATSGSNNVSSATIPVVYGVDQTITFAQNPDYTTDNVFSEITGLSPITNIKVGKDVSAGGQNAFVYETIYIGEDGTSITLRNNESGLVNTILTSNGYIELLSGSVSEKYGEYEMTNGQMVNIWYPEMTLIAYIADTTDSIDGQIVGKLQMIDFYVEAPKVAATPTTGATVKIWFTTPVSGKTSYYGESNIPTVGLSNARQLIATACADTDAAAGPYTAYAEFQTPIAFKDYAKKSNTISFTVQSTSLSITAAQDSVIRSNPFVVTISGEANTQYNVYITNPEDDANKNPTLQPGQSGYKGLSTEGYYIFETDASGKRNIQFNTGANTEDKSYTIRVEETGENPDWDEVKVKVEKGAVTMSASGDGSYYIGEEITLSGTNSDSSEVFLFITGPNLITDGEVLKSLPGHRAAFTAASPVAVKSDKTWEYKWDTSGCGLDTGAYTIYATSRLTNGKSSSAVEVNGEKAVKLSDSEYATVSVNLKQPFLSAV